jgi:hypothetical protein
MVARIQLVVEVHEDFKNSLVPAEYSAKTLRRMMRRAIRGI